MTILRGVGVGLDALGFDVEWRATCERGGHSLELVARVVGEQRGAYVVQTHKGPQLASPSGSLRHSQNDAPEAHHPAVGDWVIVRPEGQKLPGGRRQILAVLARRTCVSRKSVGRAHKAQVVAANVDFVCIVCAYGGDIQPRKIERFISIARAGGAQPVVLLNKSDLAAPNAEPFGAPLAKLAANTPMYRICAHTGAGFAALAPYLQRGKTLVLLGSSGAGKSTLLNRWLGDSSQRTGPVHTDGQGRHTTRSRTLVALSCGTLVIDTPGLRAIGLWDAEDGVAATFSDIVALAQTCHFRNCRHGTEPGCALQQACAQGSLAPDRLQAYLHLKEELAEAATRGRRRRGGPL